MFLLSLLSLLKVLHERTISLRNFVRLRFILFGQHFIMRTKRGLRVVVNQFGRDLTYPTTGMGIGKRLSPGSRSPDEEDTNDYAEETGGNEQAERPEHTERPYSKNLREQITVNRTRCNCDQLQSRCQQHQSSATITPHQSGSHRRDASHGSSINMSKNNLISGKEKSVLPDCVKVKIDNLKQEQCYDTEHKTEVGDVLIDDDELLGLGADFNILEYADPELDFKANILDSLDWNLIQD